MENYSADKPIKSETDDRFQRYGFSKRIAESIINRTSTDSITIGLYGAWGEGKSSVLHFIDIELQKDPSVIILHFNPWRYSDEDSLLLNFFTKVAALLGRELNTKKENLGNFIEKYASIGSIFGIDLGETGKIFNNTRLEDLKLRVEEFLIESKTKLVIFIDDVDRLDKNEIYSLLRLVKLTADFSSTTYILAFDEAMVASAIGERFGSTKKAGESFLEKIIQVPLTIPKAQPEALQQLCFDLLNITLETNGVELEDVEAQRFAYQFTSNILSSLNTPRLAVRYGNSLSFSLPLLYHEVNTVDLMLIEAIKIFYPEHYYFIKANPRYFIETYVNKYSGTNDQEKIDQLKEYLDKLGESMNIVIREQVKDLLCNLFPHLNTVYGNYHYSDTDYENWYQNKRIVSEHYFNRYFAYVVIKGEVSDIEFASFITDISTGEIQNIEEITKKMSTILENSNANNFIMKLRSVEKTLDWKSSKLLFKSISNITELLPREGKIMHFDSPFSQATAFIYSILKTNKGKENIFEVGKELMTFPKDFSFSYNLNNYFRSGETIADKLFTEQEYIELAKILVDRAVEEAGDDSIFNKFQDYNGYLVTTWATRDRTSFDKYIEEFLNKNEKNVMAFIKAFIPTIKGLMNVPKLHKTNLNQDVFNAIVSYYNMEKIYQKILLVIPEEELLDVAPYWDDIGTHEFTEINMLRQFVHFYNQKKREETTAPSKDEA